eukprot:3793531-Amphidinium_carterae.1
MNRHERYIVSAKQLHEIQKRCLSLDGTATDPKLLTRGLSMHSLAGRGNWPAKEDLASEVAERTN